MKITRNQQGLTLIELLVVISIIAILAAIIYVAIDPARRIRDANDSQRWADVEAVVSAVHLYINDNDGALPNEGNWVDGRTYVLGTSAGSCGASCGATTTESNCLDLEDLTSDGKLGKIPHDPTTGSDFYTDYYIFRNGSVIYAGACDPQGNDDIEVIR